MGTLGQMRRSLAFKMIAAFLGVSLLAVGLVVVFAAIVGAMEFNRLVSQEATNNFFAFVRDYYESTGSLEGIEDALRNRLRKEGLGEERPRLFLMALTDPSGRVVLSGEGYHRGEQVPSEILKSGTAIRVNQRVIGVALPRRLPPPRTRAQEQFLQTAGVALALAASGAALVGVLFGIFLTRTITRPLRELTQAARRMARGELGQVVNVHTRDEVGELAAAFNQMSADLARADRVRRQMTADIAHELRNPLTVISGYLDAMRSGDLAPTPARLEAVHREIRHLEHIVDDLRTLSLADAGALGLNRQPLAPHELLQRAVARDAPRAQQKQIMLILEAADDLPEIALDEARMMQVLGNLMDNALRHTPPQGTIHLSARRVGDQLEFRIADSGEGIASADLPHVFERFYRGDRARAREEDSEESGLGLAIAKALVEAHGGRIWAESEKGKGATFVIALPLR